MTRTVRIQGAIVRDHLLLLIKHREHATGREYWLLPGGGIEAGETEEACLIREMREETCLDVRIERLLCEEPNTIDHFYQARKTWLCTPLGGVARPGIEPEEEAAEVYAITEVQWIDLRHETTWGAAIVSDPWAYPLIRRIQHELAYRSDPASGG